MYVGLIRLFLVEFTAGGDVAVIYGSPTAPWAITPCMSSSVSRLLISGRVTKYRHHGPMHTSLQHQEGRTTHIAVTIVLPLRLQFERKPDPSAHTERQAPAFRIANPHNAKEAKR